MLLRLALGRPCLLTTLLVLGTVFPSSDPPCIAFGIPSPPLRAALSSSYSTDESSLMRAAVNCLRGASMKVTS